MCSIAPYPALCLFAHSCASPPAVRIISWAPVSGTTLFYALMPLPHVGAVAASHATNSIACCLLSCARCASAVAPPLRWRAPAVARRLCRHGLRAAYSACCVALSLAAVEAVRLYSAVVPRRRRRWLCERGARTFSIAPSTPIWCARPRGHPARCIVAALARCCPAMASAHARVPPPSSLVMRSYRLLGIGRACACSAPPGVVAAG